MVFKEIVNGIEVLFMLVGLLIVLPPIFLYRLIRFMRK